MKKNFILLFTTALFLTGFSQKNSVLRVEIEPKYSSESFNILPCKEEGIIIFSETKEKESGNRFWHFSRYDTELKESWNENIPIPKTLDYKDYFYDTKEKKLHILFCQREHSNNNSELPVYGNYRITSIDLKSNKYSLCDGKFEKYFRAKDFKVISDFAYICGNTTPSPDERFSRMCACYLGFGIPYFFGISNFKPKGFLCEIDLRNQKAKTDIDIINGMSEYTNVSKDENNDVIYPCISRWDKSMKGTCTIYQKTSDESMRELIELNQKEFNITNAQLSALNNGGYIIAGTYREKPKKYSKPIKDVLSSEGNQGFIIGKLDKNNGLDFLKTYNFAKMPDLQDNLIKWRKKKVERELAKGKESNLDLYLLIHNVIVNKDEITLVAEIYIMVYTQYCSTSHDSKGIPTTSCYTVFEGYETTHALLAGFSNDGELLWDKVINVEGALTSSLRKKIKTIIDGDKVTVVYNYNGQLMSRSFSGREFISEKEITKIETSEEDDDVKKSWSDNIEWWYDNYYVAYGYQKIKNMEKDKKKRTVFYFNKIKYD